jgi:hypothetical protein
MASSADRDEAADAALLGDLSAFLAAEKAPSVSIQWVEDGGYLRFTATLDVGEVTEDRARLMGRAHASMPDRSVSLTFTWQGAAGRPQPFERFEWRPHDRHTNKPIVPKPHRHRSIETTHRHPLALNARVAGGLAAAMAENLPAAEALAPEPPDWTAFTATAAVAWRIPALVHLPAPPWQYDLLPLATSAERGGRGR